MTRHLETPFGLIRCPGSGQRTLRGRIAEPDRCPVCGRIAYVRLDGTTGSHPTKSVAEDLT